MKKKNTIVTLLLVLGLISFTIGVSIAFFNYTRTGSENTLSVGRIYFTSSQSGTINLTNVFPIKETQAGTDSTNSSEVIITITGDTTYSEGVEYLVTFDDVNNTINNKKIPIGVIVTPEKTGELGTSDNDYFTNRGSTTSIYKSFISNDDVIKNGKYILAGYIRPGASQVNGTIGIRAFIDADKIAISDTFDGNETDNMGTTNNWVDERTVLTTTEWNSLQTNGVSFKVRVEANEGIWVIEPLTAIDKIKRNVNTTTLINFANASSSTNGQGLYILPGTENDTNPIYYYRGAVNNNNVIFGGYCWQMVRTTDTGGIKMIYNGEPLVTGSGANVTYDCGGTRPVGHIGEIKLTESIGSSTGYYYADDYEIVSGSGMSITYRLKQGTNPITQVALTSANASTAISDIVTNYPYTCKQATADATCTRLYKVDSQSSGVTANVYAATPRSSMGSITFNASKKSMSDVGYMSNTRYPISDSNWTTGALFASSATWVNDHYELTDASVTTPDTTHHYSCNATTSNATCTDLRYVYNVEETTKNYITLSGGETLEDALYKMTGNGDAIVKARNSSYNINVNNSTAKTAIDDWFRTYLTNEVDNTKKNYASYLEDTVYCNDRSFKTITGDTSYPTYQESGWNPNGGDLTIDLYFGSWNRFRNSYYSTTNVPSTTCPNETDRFTVSSTNGNGALTYPVGLLTADEIIMAGVSGSGSATTNYYLYTGDYDYSLSPDYSYSACMFAVVAINGRLGNYSVISSGGIRPVVSLKPGTEFLDDGDGTATSPYVVKYN